MLPPQETADFQISSTVVSELGVRVVDQHLTPHSLMLLLQLLATLLLLRGSDKAVVDTFSMSMFPERMTSLQTYHLEHTPSEVLQQLSSACIDLGIDQFDVYGDFDKSSSSSSSFLRQFEKELAEDFGKEDAVFMPSGVMTQQIALLINHRDIMKSEGKPEEECCEFACHDTSHLLLHEENAYSELIHMKAIVVRSGSTNDDPSCLSVPAMTFHDVEQALKDKAHQISTLILEVPHRELGGKLTPFDDMQQMQRYCQQHSIRFHCDGARIFEASAGYGCDIEELSALFDSVYISFYKGLGGLSGSALLGSAAFCCEARIWLRRFGGNLFTLLPYIVSAITSYRRNWKMVTSGKVDDGNETQQQQVLSFREKKEKMVRIIELLTANDCVRKIVRFDPPVPETNMVHGYILVDSLEACQQAIDDAASKSPLLLLLSTFNLSMCWSFRSVAAANVRRWCYRAHRYAGASSAMTAERA